MSRLFIYKSSSHTVDIKRRDLQIKYELKIKKEVDKICRENMYIQKHRELIKCIISELPSKPDINKLIFKYYTNK